MSTLTINIDGKKYHWADKSTEMDGAWLTNDTIKDLIRAGVLVEEVEKKPYTGDIDIPTGKPFKSGSTTQVYSTVKDPSILEKLRFDIEARRRGSVIDQEHSKGFPETIRYYEGKERAYEVCLDLLTSLETKEEPCTHPIGKESKCSVCGEDVSFYKEQPQFTPGQEIEVSQDEIHWYPRTFIDMSDCGTGFIARYKKGKKEGWKYARPLKEESPQRDLMGRLPGDFMVGEYPEESPEIVVPDFEMIVHPDFAVPGFMVQIQTLTKAVQQLQSKAKKQ